MIEKFNKIMGGCSLLDNIIGVVFFIIFIGLFIFFVGLAWEDINYK